MSENRKGAIALVAVILLMAAPGLFIGSRKSAQSRVYDARLTYQEPVLRESPLPAYPKRVKEAGVVLTGRVRIPIVIERDGSVVVKEEKNIRSSLPKRVGFEKAAIKAVKRWRYDPARKKNGEVVRSELVVAVQFGAEHSDQHAGGGSTPHVAP